MSLLYRLYTHELSRGGKDDVVYGVLQRCVHGAAGEIETQRHQPVQLQKRSRLFQDNHINKIAGGETDPSWGNNDDGEVTQVDVEHDLTITKKDGPDPVTAGTNLTYTLDLTNTGPSDAAGVVVSETLPPDVSFVTYTASAGSFDGNAGV